MAGEPIPGVESAIYIGDTERGWDLSPDTGAFGVGSVGNYEDYYSAGNTSIQRAALKADFNATLDTFRYGTASKGLDQLVGHATARPWVVHILGNGNGNGLVVAETVTSNTASAAVGNIVKLGKVAVQGFESSSPADGIVTASGELPYIEGAFEGVQLSDTVADDNAKRVKLAASASGVAGPGIAADITNANDEWKLLFIVRETPGLAVAGGNGIKVRGSIGSANGAQVDVVDASSAAGAAAKDYAADNECRIFEIPLPTTGTAGSVAVDFTFSGGVTAGTELEGILALGKSIDN